MRFLTLFTVLVLLATGAASADPTVLITGSNRGIGLEFARQYAEADWRVIATCRTPAEAAELQAIAEQHSNLEIRALDITDHSAVDQLADDLATVGIDLLINNAALLGNRQRQAFGGIDYELMERILAVNVMGTLKVSEAFTPHLRSAGGKLMVLGSAAGSNQLIGPEADYFAYRASKAALHQTARNMALALADSGVVVGLVNPGLVDTRNLSAIGPDDPVPDDFRQVVALIRSGQLKLITPEDSVKAMRALFAELGPEDAGNFINYDGSRLPW